GPIEALLQRQPQIQAWLKEDRLIARTRRIGCTRRVSESTAWSDPDRFGRTASSACSREHRVRGRSGSMCACVGSEHLPKLLINRAAENNSMMQRDDEHLLDLAANRVRSLSQVTN